MSATTNSLTICVDANVIVDWALGEDIDSPEAPVNQWLRANTRLVAPSLFHFEIVNVLYRAHRAKKAPLSQARAMIRFVFSLPIETFDDEMLHLDALAIADRFNLPATYDAHYLALAEQQDAEFWTADKRLFNSVQPHLPWVHLIPIISPASDADVSIQG